MESIQQHSEECDIGPPPRVVLEDGELAATENAKECIVSDNSESNLDIDNQTLVHDQHKQSTTQKCLNASPNGLDLGNLTCISGTKISPGFSSFETFKPKAQNRKQKCNSPIHKPLERKTILDIHKSLPTSRLPKPKVYTAKTASKIKPPLIKRSAQLNFSLSSLTSIKNEDEVTQPKKVPPPVPPRRSSLTTISKTSLEEYADKLGSTEPQEKTEKPKSSLKVPVGRLNNPTETEHSKDVNKTHKSEDSRRTSLQRGHTVEKSARPHFLTNPPSEKPVKRDVQMTRCASYESSMKNGHIVMTSGNAELEKVYKKITKFNWNSTEFDSQMTNLSPSMSSSCNSNARANDSPCSSLTSSSSKCSIDNDVMEKQAYTTITSIHSQHGDNN